uniref:F-box domain-containing protein n=1 Tax=Panagrellus redivivus TaxID=6233 RepID=A0A7E4UVK1_PANRE
MAAISVKPHLIGEIMVEILKHPSRRGSHDDRCDDCPFQTVSLVALSSRDALTAFQYVAKKHVHALLQRGKLGFYTTLSSNATHPIYNPSYYQLRNTCKYRPHQILYDRSIRSVKTLVGFNESDVWSDLKTLIPLLKHRAITTLQIEGICNNNAFLTQLFTSWPIEDLTCEPKFFTTMLTTSTFILSTLRSITFAECPTDATSLFQNAHRFPALAEIRFMSNNNMLTYILKSAIPGVTFPKVKRLFFQFQIWSFNEELFKNLISVLKIFPNCETQDLMIETSGTPCYQKLEDVAEVHESFLKRDYGTGETTFIVRDVDCQMVMGRIRNRELVFKCLCDNGFVKCIHPGYLAVAHKRRGNTKLSHYLDIEYRGPSNQRFDELTWKGPFQSA